MGIDKLISALIPIAVALYMAGKLPQANAWLLREIAKSQMKLASLSALNRQLFSGGTKNRHHGASHARTNH